MLVSTSLRTNRRLLVTSGSVAVFLGLGAAYLSFRYFRAEVLAEATDDRSFRTSLVHVTSEAAKPPLLTLDTGTLPSGVISSRRLEAVQFQPSVPAVGNAVDPVDLATTRDRLVEATQAAEQANVQLQAAELETAFRSPVVLLPGTGTDPSSETAANAVRLGQADLRKATDAFGLRRAVALALYGPGLTGWMISASSSLDAIIQSRASLLLLTLLPGYDAPLPPQATVRGRRGESVPARLVSVAYRIDPRFQNVAALYQTEDDPADPHFLPGPPFSASLPVGSPLNGVAVPASAVLQFEGKVWTYVEESPRRFRRREISLAHALPDGSGWLQDPTFQPDQTVVVAGAALLLEAEQAEAH